MIHRSGGKGRCYNVNCLESAESAAFAAVRKREREEEKKVERVVGKIMAKIDAICEENEENER